MRSVQEFIREQLVCVLRLPRVMAQGYQCLQYLCLL